MPRTYDALLVVSFGGPDGPEDVLPFLENVLRGRNVPHERMLEVAEHYHHFGGKSPINEQNRRLVAALEQELSEHGPPVPVYFGNRNWRPLLPDTLRQMAADGVRRALAFVTSAFGSYSGCRQYLENIEQARQTVGPGAPVVEKLRLFYNHPGFIQPMIERTRAALDQLTTEARDAAPLVFTAHSIPTAMAATCRYEEQLHEACRLVGEGVGRSDWRLAYQSRSGSPRQPWLGPDVAEVATETRRSGSTDLVVVPIGFLSDHMEVLYDLDVELRQACQAAGTRLTRAATVGCHPRFVRMIRELMQERIDDSPRRPFLGALGTSPDVCRPECCAYTSGAQINRPPVKDQGPV